MQAQMLQTMQQTMVNLHAQPQAPPPPRDSVGISYASLKAHKIVNVALHWEYSSGIAFIFS
jgi:hypothetical protein